MWIKSFDFYRNIPKDLTESTSHGAILSVAAAIFMVTLFLLEIWAYMNPGFRTDVIIDPIPAAGGIDSLLRINFNITVMNIPCEFATIDVVDVLGTRNDNVTKNINKWAVDENGVRRNYEGRNREQKDLDHDTHHDLDALHANGVHALSISTAEFDDWIGSHEYSFVNFYAPWCIWCNRLAPVWEAYAERIEAEGLPVSVVKVNCDENRELCIKSKIQAFPTLRFFKRNENMDDYRSDRTVDALFDYARNAVGVNRDPRRLEVPGRAAQGVIGEEDHPGCMLSGFLLVNRVPGNFHIESRSKHHNLNPIMANLSHIVNHLSFGNPINPKSVAELEALPETYYSYKNTRVIDNRAFVQEKFHQAHHHYMKVVSTLVNRHVGDVNRILSYQVLHSSQVMQYEEEEIPEARFSYDVAPMAVSISRQGKRFGSVVTSLCAVIGGTFTVLGLVNGMLSTVFKKNM